MKFTSLCYVLLAAVMGFAAGTLHSCMERERAAIAAPVDVEIPANDPQQVDL